MCCSNLGFDVVVSELILVETVVRSTDMWADAAEAVGGIAEIIAAKMIGRKNKDEPLRKIRPSTGLLEPVTVIILQLVVTDEQFHPADILEAHLGIVAQALRQGIGIIRRPAERTDIPELFILRVRIDIPHIVVDAGLDVAEYRDREFLFDGTLPGDHSIV
jgi:hypothetical protein